MAAWPKCRRTGLLVLLLLSAVDIPRCQRFVAVAGAKKPWPLSGSLSREAISVSSLQESIPEHHEAGDAVEAVYPENSLSYPALILGINDDSTYTVQWVGDAPEGPSGTSAVKPEDIEQVSRKFAAGDAVEVSREDGPLRGTVVSMGSAPGTLAIQWQDE